MARTKEEIEGDLIMVDFRKDTQKVYKLLASAGVEVEKKQK